MDWDRLTVLMRHAGQRVALALRRLDPAVVAVLGRAVRQRVALIRHRLDPAVVAVLQRAVRQSVALTRRRLDPAVVAVLGRAVRRWVALGRRGLDPALVAGAALVRAVRRHPGRTAALVVGLGGAPLLALVTWAWWTVAFVDLGRLH